MTAAICQNTDKSIMNDGFRSFPSGHSSFSSAGLIYLSLFIASKFAVTIPFLPPAVYSSSAARFIAFPSRAEKALNRNPTGITQDKNLPSPTVNSPAHLSSDDNAMIAVRNQAASPPVYLLIFTIIPWFASIYISSTRYSDFRHHGFDILFGYLIGTLSAFFGKTLPIPSNYFFSTNLSTAFRYYHLPISRGGGWSYGPRSRDKAFWRGVGEGTYATNKEMDVANGTDVESGAMASAASGNTK